MPAHAASEYFRPLHDKNKGPFELGGHFLGSYQDLWGWFSKIWCADLYWPIGRHTCYSSIPPPPWQERIDAIQKKQQVDSGQETSSYEVD